jgi:hypothetical protein
MSKLFDDVMSDSLNIRPPRWIEAADPEIVPTGAKLVKRILRGATVFDITNVSDYYFGGTDQEWFDPKIDFGCVRAPFAHFWMEFRRPTKVKSVLNLDCDLFALPERTGILGVVLDMRAPDVMRFTAKSVGYECKKYSDQPRAFENGRFSAERIGPEILDAVECLHLRSFINSGRTLVGPQSHMYVWIRENGSVIDYVNASETVGSLGRPTPRETSGFETHMYPALMALDMIHARNVRVVDFAPPPKLARQFKRKRGVGMVSWKTVVILPFVERVLYDEKQKVREGVGSRPFSIVPGHYAHYGVEGPGGWIRGKLFGKVSGRFWISEHGAGDESSGVIVKDYKMAEPDAEPAAPSRRARRTRVSNPWRTK